MIGGDGINPKYSVIGENESYGIEGTEATSGEKVLIADISQNFAFVFELADFLEKHSVSVHHAKDVIRDRFAEMIK